MSTSEERWRAAFARQALADKRVYEYLCKGGGRFSHCHRLHYLQMFLEKLAKSYRLGDQKERKRLPDLSRSHKIIEKVLPLIVREFWREVEGETKPDKSQLDRIRRICREIDLLAPSVDEDGRRADNCEYPWPSTTDTKVIAPTDYSFPVDQSLHNKDGRMLLKIANHYIETSMAPLRLK